MADVLKKLKALYNPVNRAARKDKRAKKLEDKAEDIAYKHSGSYDTYHSIDDGAIDEKIKAKLDIVSQHPASNMNDNNLTLTIMKMCIQQLICA